MKKLNGVCALFCLSSTVFAASSAAQAAEAASSLVPKLVQEQTVAIPIIAPQPTPTTFRIDMTDGSATLMSQSVAYTTVGALSAAPIGSTPTPGFIRLCQTGDTSVRAAELAADANVPESTSTTALIYPGQTGSVELTIKNPTAETIHVETMYGNTKDACSVITVTNDVLAALVSGAKTDSVGADQIVLSGAFLDPALPSPGTPGSVACAGHSSATGCLRGLALPNTGAMQVRYFPGYLPSVLNAIEEAFGAPAAQTLVIPTSGAIQYRITKVN